MRFGIIGAMTEETTPFIKSLENPVTEKVGTHEYVTATYKGHEVVLVTSGIGKVCAAMAVSTLHLKYHVDCIINTGTAGGLGKGLHIGDVVLASGMAYHDFDLTIFGYKLGQVPRYEQIFHSDPKLLATATQAAEKLKADGTFAPYVHQGLCLSGDRFISDKAKGIAMMENFPETLIMEMESAAVGQVCTDFGVPCLIIRSVSDTAEGDSPDDFNKFVDLASENGARLVLETIALS